MSRSRTRPEKTRLLAAAVGLAALLLAGAPPAAGAEAPIKRYQPYVGYVYPAGGRQDSSFEILVGGQNLRGVNGVYITGEGVEASVTRYLRPLSRKQMGELGRRLRDEYRRRRAKAAGRKPTARTDKAGRAGKAPREKIDLPDHPMFQDLEAKTERELQDVAVRFLGAGRMRQPNQQLAENVEIRVTVEPGAAPGNREIRLLTPRGLTNPLQFRVGVLPEVRERETLSPKSGGLRHLGAQRIPAGVIVNGQVLPGDVDRFRFPAKEGERLVIRTEARSLVPYLADAVPGWFQAVTTVYDTVGREVAFSDDWRFDPDPTVLFEVPEDGDYIVEIRDAIYRGREDFVYRISIAESPFVTALFPLGGRVGEATTAAVSGWNLSKRLLPLDTGVGAARQRWVSASAPGEPATGALYAVDDLPECEEQEPNDDGASAQALFPARVVNGRIDRPGDVDAFVFDGHAGQEIVADVLARRLRSPLDSLLRLTDAAGNVIAWNDDREDAGSGLLTHDADSWLQARLPADGLYRVQVSDAQRNGGPAFAYRLRVGPPRPDFDVFVTPSSVSCFAGRSVPLHVQVLRKEGFEGAIDLRLADGHGGFVLSGARVPPGRDDVRMTITAPGARMARPVELEIEAHARIDGVDVRRAVVPADHVTQAFITPHLLPAQRLIATVGGKRRSPPAAQLVSQEPLQISPGGSAEVQVRIPGRALPKELRLALETPPAGLTLHDLTIVRGRLSFVVRADATVAEAGYADNLIVAAYLVRAAPAAGKGDGKPKKKAGAKNRKAAKAARRIPIGYLPAIPIEIVPSN